MTPCLYVLGLAGGSVFSSDVELKANGLKEAEVSLQVVSMPVSKHQAQQTTRGRQNGTQGVRLVRQSQVVKLEGKLGGQSRRGEGQKRS